MAKVILPVNFQDDIINQDMNGKRRYNMITNSDGTVSFEDVTAYDQIGSNYGANQVNSTNEAVNQSADANKILDNIDDINANTQSGYIAGALAVKELNSNLDKYYKKQYNQRGVAITDNLNGYFRSKHVTFQIPYKKNTYPAISLVPENNANTNADSRITVLYKHVSNTGFDLYVADSEGQIANIAYSVIWMAIGEID